MASLTLRIIAAAQEDFRKKGLDSNGVADYWRKDIAGLYVFGKDAGILTDSFAMADDRAATDLTPHVRVLRAPRAGFWVRAIRLPGEKELTPDRFAACCFPSNYGPGIRSHYVINQEGVVYKKDLGHGKGIDVYPADPLREGWEKVD